MPINPVSHDITLLRELGQDISRASSVEVLVASLHRGLCRVASAKETRVVALEAPNLWKEWIAGSETAGVRVHRSLPPPKAKGITEYFDDQNQEAGFLWVAGRDGMLGDVARMIAPHVHTAILWHTAIRRTRHLNGKEKSFSQASLRARDEERRLIARELHDDLGQSLVSMRLSLKWVEGLVSKAPGMEEALHLRNDRRRARQDSRRLAHALPEHSRHSWLGRGDPGVGPQFYKTVRHRNDLLAERYANGGT
jgi:signal transduction histidine kinase